jgi:hypothetical protein
VPLPVQPIESWAMNRPLVFGLVFLCGVASGAAAQTKGRISAGVSTTINVTPDGDVGTGKGVGVLVRLNPKPGWGPAGAFNWFKASLTEPVAGRDDFATLRIRPLMGGVSYNTVRGRLLTSYSIVAGPSFNRARFTDRFARSPGDGIDADTSFAVRPGVGLTYTLRERMALVGFGGYLINRPSVTYRTGDGVEIRDQWKADAVVLSIGVVYSIF